MIKIKHTGERADVVGYCGHCIPSILICRIVDSMHFVAFFRSELVDDVGGQEINNEIARLERAREDGEL